MTHKAGTFTPSETLSLHFDAWPTRYALLSIENQIKESATCHLEIKLNTAFEYDELEKLKDWTLSLRQIDRATIEVQGKLYFNYSAPFVFPTLDTLNSFSMFKPDDSAESDDEYNNSVGQVQHNQHEAIAAR